MVECEGSGSTTTVGISIGTVLRSAKRAVAIQRSKQRGGGEGESEEEQEQERALDSSRIWLKTERYLTRLAHTQGDPVQDLQFLLRLI